MSYRRESNIMPSITKNLSAGLVAAVFAAVAAAYTYQPAVLSAGGPPDALTTFCLDPSDNACRSFQRAECDAVAARNPFASYRSGFTRPILSTDDVGTFDCVPPTEPFVCLGVPGTSSGFRPERGPGCG